MKILYHHRIASKDGQYVHIEELTQALKRRGHELIFVGPKITEGASFGSENGFVAWLKRRMPGFVYELVEFTYALLAYRKLISAVKCHNPDCLYERYNLYMPAGVWLKKRSGLPMVLEVNAPLYEERKRYGGIALPMLARWSEHYTWNGADHVLPVTEVLADYVRGSGVPDERITVIPNGIDPEKFVDVEPRDKAKKRLGLSGKTVLGFIGFMREWHRLDLVVDILVKHEIRTLHLLLVGDGPVRDSLIARAIRLGVKERLTITGVMDRKSVARYAAAFDIALQPDVVAYASPLKLFEYLAMGCAVVAPDRPNIREVLTHGDNGYLFNPDVNDSFSCALLELLADPSLRVRLGKRAKESIIERGYTWSQNAFRVEQIILNLQNRRTM
jgi:glycosyltransferase involved in cell wall biosynthesis